MNNLLQIGAGNIGRACVGRLFHNADYRVYFFDVNKELLALLEEYKAYPVRMVGQGVDELISVDEVSSLNDNNKNDVYATLDMITTAVGVPILPKIAPLIAEIISYRCKNGITDPVNIVACENAVRASSQLKSLRGRIAGRGHQKMG